MIDQPGIKSKRAPQQRYAAPAGHLWTVPGRRSGVDNHSAGAV